MKVFREKKNRHAIARLIQNASAINRSPANFYTVSLAKIYQLDIYHVAPEVYLCTNCGRRWLNISKLLILYKVIIWDVSVPFVAVLVCYVYIESNIYGVFLP